MMSWVAFWEKKKTKKKPSDWSTLKIKQFSGMEHGSSEDFKEFPAIFLPPPIPLDAPSFLHSSLKKIELNFAFSLNLISPVVSVLMTVSNFKQKAKKKMRRNIKGKN